MRATVCRQEQKETTLVYQPNTYRRHSWRPIIYPGVSVDAIGRAARLHDKTSSNVLILDSKVMMMSTRVEGHSNVQYCTRGKHGVEETIQGARMCPPFCGSVRTTSAKSFPRAKLSPYAA
jgi:hypothetical protein